MYKKNYYTLKGRGIKAFIRYHYPYIGLKMEQEFGRLATIDDFSSGMVLVGSLSSIAVYSIMR